MPMVAAPKLQYWPIVVLRNDKAPHNCWLAWRRSGIGGSDVAKILGVCPFGTARDLYYSKKGIVDPEDEEANKWAKYIGHLMEDTVALMFSEATGLPVFRLPYMFRSPKHPYMLADIDFGIIFPDGSIGILECKSTGPDAVRKWWDGKTPVIPANYMLQGRHYMAVLELNRVFFACLYGNSEKYLLWRELRRDAMIESEMICHEGHFWKNHYLADIPPPYVESGVLCEKSVKRHHGNAGEAGNSIILSEAASALLPQFLQNEQVISRYNAAAKPFKDENARIKAIITDELGINWSARCLIGGEPYVVSFPPTQKSRILKDQLVQMQLLVPEVYDQFVTTSSERKFSVKHVTESQEMADTQDAPQAFEAA